MPYLKPELRKPLNPPINRIISNIADSGSGQAGQLNYVISRIVFRLLCRRGWNYAVLNEFIGALECCKLELYRRLVANYENLKAEENGDVFGV